MKTKMCVKTLCVAMVVSIMAGTFTGCQTNVAEGIIGEQVTVENNASTQGADNKVKATWMDASLNLDLGMFTLYGRPLGDWTYEELYGFICDNFQEKQDSDVSTTFNGVNMQGRFLLNPLDQITANILDQPSSIQLNVNGVNYVMANTDWNGSLWSLYPFNHNSGDIVSSICGQRVEDYLESICPGLYAKLQEEPRISLKNGVAEMDSTSGGMQRIVLSLNGGSLELWYEAGVITSLTVLFSEYWQVTTEANATIGDGFYALNLGQYKLFDKSLLEWNIKNLAEYIRKTYEVTYSSEEQETFILGTDSSEDIIWISGTSNEIQNICISYHNGASISISGTEERILFIISCEAAQRGVLEEHGLVKLAALFGMTPRDYLESVKPGLYDTLSAEGSIQLGDNPNLVENISLDSISGLNILIGSVSINLSTNPENGLINNCSIELY